MSLLGSHTWTPMVYLHTTTTANHLYIISVFKLCNKGIDRIPNDPIRMPSHIASVGAIGER